MDLQVVFVKWGDDYSCHDVNRAVRAVRRHATCKLRFVCVCDDPTSDYDPDIACRHFPDFAAPNVKLRQGCRLKLSIFAPGVLVPGVPALYLDLDTLIRGDVDRLRRLVVAYPALYLLRSHFLPLWRIPRWCSRAVGGIFYWGNSSAMAFMPEDYNWLFRAFNKALQRHGARHPNKRVGADDRFISRQAQETLRVFPASLIVKFTDEYLSHLHLLQALRSRLPWVRTRRERLVAVTFAGASVKPSRLAQLEPGAEIRHKRRRGRWHHPEFRQYWTA